ncbi:anaerobic selenocysteine-containing dehydrogenase [Kribbella orskensis]|uniref:Anaerobic selenocysteine-containing dehydrogenase n=1 Tax=Kribbella orskensis TaxID=2512216 RepID=A0ABY2BK48_9ACTN|nr:MULTISPECIES: molybdopterin-dependent oxidoreductase [Kribbella]TCN40207.1 anaerobic selenocysteine-containing dehydrogenase [Kribbella sp. VKM Ac-2500]TCO22827.1 anaerobic selenocysteine-containing dehydrogenase [Kribbella orskensis]
MATVRRTSCNLCEAICGVLVTVEDGHVTDIRGDEADPLSRGHICPKAVALRDLQEDPDRLTTPVRRTADGWEELGWDEAYELVAAKLTEIQKEHGKNSVGVYLGNPNVHSLGALTHMPTAVRQLGTRNRFSATSVDQLPHMLASHLLYGHQLMVPVADIDRTSYLLMLGANPLASNGSMMTAPGFGRRLKEVQKRGGGVVVIDPRRSETAAVADEHHFVRPGTDAAFLLALIHQVIADGHARLAQYVDGLEAVTEATREWTPERAAPVTGIDADTIRRIAREFAGADKAACYGRVGVSTQQFGAVCQWAVQVLNIITGNLDRPGGTMIPRPAVDTLRGIGRGHIGVWKSRVRGLPEFSGELPASVMAEEILTPGDGQIRAMVTIAGNPVLSTPNGRKLDEALGTLDFMVCVDPYINETTRHADVILPPTPPLERDHYDLAFHQLAVRNTARWNDAVLPRPPEARHDWEIFRGLGLALLRRTPRSRRKVIASARLRLSPKRVVDLGLRIGPYRLSVGKLRKSRGGIDLGPLQPALPGALRNKSKRIDLAQRMILDDLPRLSAFLLAGRNGLVLIGRRHLRSNNSWMHNSARLVKGKPRHQLLMNPDDLLSRDLEDGQLVHVSSAAGSVDVEVAASKDMMPGVVSLPHGFGHGRPGARLTIANQVAGASANDVTDADLTDTLAGTAALNGVPVKVTAAAVIG